MVSEHVPVQWPDSAKVCSERAMLVKIYNAISRIAGTVVAVFTVALFLPACQGGSLSLPPANRSGESTRSVSTAAPSNLLFVSDEINNQILVFDAAAKTQNPTPLSGRTIAAGIQGPLGITTDLAGNLYVANYLANTVTVYGRGATKPKQTISRGLNGPWDVKVDGSGNVYVANQPALLASSFINEYAAGASVPEFTWYPPENYQLLTGLALLNPKKPSSIYAAEYTPHGKHAPTWTILACHRGKPTCAQVGSALTGRTGGIAVEQSPGGTAPFEYLVATENVVYVYQNSSAPVLVDQLPIQGNTRFIALDATRSHLFVANGSSNEIDELAFPKGNIVNRFKSPLSGSSWGVATDPAGSYF